MSGVSIGLFFLILANGYGIKILTDRIRGCEDFCKNLAGMMELSAQREGEEIGVRALKRIAITYPLVADHEECTELFSLAIDQTEQVLGKEDQDSRELVDCHKAFVKCRRMWPWGNGEAR